MRAPHPDLPYPRRFFSAAAFSLFSPQRRLFSASQPWPSPRLCGPFSFFLVERLRCLLVVCRRGAVFSVCLLCAHVLCCAPFLHVLCFSRLSLLLLWVRVLCCEFCFSRLVLLLWCVLCMACAAFLLLGLVVPSVFFLYLLLLHVLSEYRWRSGRGDGGGQAVSCGKVSSSVLWGSWGMAPA